jgi:transcriptional regulator GlxA family with amidase domain
MSVCAAVKIQYVSRALIASAHTLDELSSILYPPLTESAYADDTRNGAEEGRPMGSVAGVEVDHEAHDGGSEPASYTMSLNVWLIVRYLHENFSQPTWLSDAALLIGVRPDDLRRRFRREVGITLREYLLRVRLECAARLLSQSSHTISEIASEVGFTSAGSFSKAFKQLMACAPTTYRARRLARSEPP